MSNLYAAQNQQRLLQMQMSPSNNNNVGRYSAAAASTNNYNRRNQYNSPAYDDYYDYDYTQQSAAPAPRPQNNRVGQGGGAGGVYRNSQSQQKQVNRNGLSNRRIQAAASGGYGSHSSGYEKCDNGISIGLLLTAALGIAVMFYTLYTKITMAGRRRKRRSEELEEDINPLRFTLDHITDFAFSGNV
jgi:hypothetical protein